MVVVRAGAEAWSSGVGGGRTRKAVVATRTGSMIEIDDGARFRFFFSAPEVP